MVQFYLNRTGMRMALSVLCGVLMAFQLRASDGYAGRDVGGARSEGVSCLGTPTVIATKTDPSCADGSTGQIVASVSLVGSPPFPTYEYRLAGAVSRPYQSSGTFSGLPSGNYQIFAREVGCTQEGLTTSTLSAPTSANVISATGITTSQATVNWSQSSANVLFYTIRYRVQGSISWTTLSGIPASFASRTITGLQNNTTYEVQIASTCTSGGAQSNFAPAAPFTFTTVIESASCRTPSAVFVINESYTSAEVRWTSVATGTCYLVSYGVTGSSTTTWPENAVGNVTSTTITGLTPGTSYRVRVRAVCGATAGDCASATRSNFSPQIPLNTVPCPSALVLNNGASAAVGCGIGTLTQTNVIAGSGLTYAWQRETTPGVFTTDASLGSATTATITTSGTYRLTLTIAGCVNALSSNPVTVNVVTAINVGASTTTNVTCLGGSNGSASASASAGTAPYTYAWSTGANTAVASGLSAGVYTVTATDANGCTGTGNVTVTQPSVAVNANVLTLQSVSCFGGNNGIITSAPFNGINPYTFNWSNGGNSATVNNAIAGTYTVTVTDGAGCSSIASGTVTEPATPLALSTAVTNIGCIGNATGAVNLTVSGGTTPYSYAWSNGQNVEDLASVPAGTYTVLVTDVRGCTATASATVTEPATGISIASSVTNVLCFGNATGAVVTNVTGGTTPYTYAWTGAGAGTDLRTGLVAGTYTVTVTDNAGCTRSATYNVTQPAAALSATVGGLDVTCNGLSNGTIDVTVAGGTTPYTYNWGAQAGTGTNSRIGLPAGTYTVTITDGNGCVLTASDVVTQPAVLAISGAVISNARCLGAMNGAVDITVTGGTTPYGFAWTGGRTTEDLMNIGAGSYTGVVTDANGCTTSATVTVTEPATNPLMVSTTPDHVSCFNGMDGEVMATATMGLAPYSYTWSTMPVQATATATGLVAGTYTVTVVDANGCVRTSSATVTQPAAFTVSGVVTNVLCNGATTGMIATTTMGGNGGNTYLWSPGGASTTNLINVGANTYTVIVTDMEGCTATTTGTITEPAVIAGNATVTNVACRGEMTGSVNLAVTGGVGAYTYLWTTGATTANLSNVVAGPYQVTITDANNCQRTASATITEPGTVLVASTTVTNVACRGAFTGGSVASAVGGVMPYTYRWSNGSTNATQTGLAAGTYTVSVTDDAGCVKTALATVTQPSTNLTISTVSVTNVACNGGTTGSAQVVGVGSTPGYTYLWSNGTPVSTIAGVAAGIYTVTVTDAGGCTSNISINITQPTPVVVTATMMNVKCNGGNDGWMAVTVSGGTVATSYAFDWNGNMTYNQTGVNIGGTIQDEDNRIDGLMAGTYTVTVTDDNNCTATVSATITQPATAITDNGMITNVLCFGASTGNVMLTPSGGVSPYTFGWSNLTTMEDLLNVPAGTYTVTITDAAGCSKDFTYIIAQPVRATQIRNFMVTNNPCRGMNMGQIYTDPSMDNDMMGIDYDSNTDFDLPTPSNFLYNWSNGQTFNPAINLLAGTYTLTITDANGCTHSMSATVTEPAAAMTVSLVSKTDVKCLGATTGAIDIDVMGGTPTYSYFWSNGSATQDIMGLGAGFYNVTVSDANSCFATFVVQITQPSTAIAAMATATNVTCFGLANGSAMASAMGGTGAYTYNWNIGASTAMVSNLPGTFAGVLYTVTVTDANMCTSTSEVVVTQPQTPVELTAAATVVNVACKGGMSGSIDPTNLYLATPVFGGTAQLGPDEYVYRWSNGQTTRMAMMLAAGTYTLTITDANGCTSNHAYTVTEPAMALMVSGAVTNVTGCAGGFNGMVDLTVTGGSMPYTYLWSNGSMNQDATMLGAGNYNVTVTDNGGCSTTRNYTVTAPITLLQAVHNKMDIRCLGTNNGMIDVTVTGGQTPYTYHWSNLQSTQDLMNLAAGTYTLTVTDGAGCTTTTEATITQPAGMALSFGATTIVNVACHGGMTGEITWTPMGGTAPYNYIWNNGVTANTANMLVAGTYSVTVTDANGCMLTNTAMITQPAMGVMIAENMITNIKCFGASTGAIDISVSGGTPAVGPTYTYLWSNGPTTQDIMGVAAGQYTVTVTDVNGCTKTYSKVLTQPATALMATAMVTQRSCASIFDINATITGGVAPYTFNWNNIVSGVEPEDQAALAAAVYTVTVMDANACSQVLTVDLTTYPMYPIGIASMVTDVLCNGASTGAIAITVTGGKTNHLYNWSNGSQLEDQTMLAAGTYTVTVTDASGCTAIRSATITQPIAPLAITWTKTDPTCGNNNGAIDVTVTGGTGLTSINWADIAGTPIFPGSETYDRASLMANTYMATVIDANNCTSNISVTLVNTGLPTLNVVANPATCPNGMNGSATVSVTTGGMAPFTYAWSNGATTASPTGLMGSPAGITYTVTVTDAKGCLVTASATITSPAMHMFNVKFCSVANAMTCTSLDSSKHVSCRGASDARLVIRMTGGTGAYFVQMSNGMSMNAAAGARATFSGLAAGSYAFTITDAAGCQEDSTVVITQPATVLTATAASTNETCPTSNNGTITVNPMGGVSTYTYLWNDAVTTQNRTMLMGTVAGTVYTVTVTDRNGCMVTATATVTEPAPIAVNMAKVTIDSVACNGGNDGAITIMAGAITGGSGTYTSYLWDDGDIFMNRTNLFAGTYMLTITDSNGCTGEFSFDVFEPTFPMMVYTRNEQYFSKTSLDGSTGTYTNDRDNPLGYTDEDQVVQLRCEDGKGRFAYSIGFDVSGDNYATGTEGIGHAGNRSYSIVWTYTNLMGASSVFKSFTVPTVAGNQAVQIPRTAAFTGAAAGLPESVRMTELNPGSYDLIVTDNEGCQASLNVIVIQAYTPLTVSVTPDQSDYLCPSDDNGDIDITVTGGNVTAGNNGNDDYYFFLSNGLAYSMANVTDAFFVNTTGAPDNDPTNTNNFSFENLTQGVYTLTVVDQEFCFDVLTVTLSNPIRPVSITTLTPTTLGVDVTVAEDASSPITGNADGVEVEFRPVGASRFERITVATDAGADMLMPNTMGALTFNTTRGADETAGTGNTGTVFGNNSNYFRGATVLQPGSYQFRIRTICNGQPTSWSAIQTTTVAATGTDPLCLPVRNIRATTVSGTAATVRWDAPTTGNAARSYQVYIKRSNVATWTLRSCVSTNQFIFTGLQIGQDYDVRVRTFCNSATVLNNTACTNSFDTGDAQGDNTTGAGTLATLDDFKDSYFVFKTNSSKENTNDDATAAVASTFSVYPNPNNGSFTVSFSSAVKGMATVKMTDLLGKVVVNNTVGVEAGLNTVPVKVEGYTAGVYLLQVQQGEEMKTTKIVLN